MIRTLAACALALLITGWSGTSYANPDMMQTPSWWGSASGTAWSAGGACTGCHTTPPTAGSSGYQIPFYSASLLANTGNLTSGMTSAYDAAPMSTFVSSATAAQQNDLLTYLIKLRDGVLASLTASATPLAGSINFDNLGSNSYGIYVYNGDSAAVSYGVGLSGSSAFSLSYDGADSDSGCTYGASSLSVPAGTSSSSARCAIRVTFDPCSVVPNSSNSNVAQMATLTIQSSGTGTSAHSVSFTGTSRYPLAASPSSVTAPPAAPGSTTDSQLTLSNVCNAPVTGLGDTVSDSANWGTGPGSSNPCATGSSSSLAAGASCTLNLAFHPQAVSNTALTAQLNLAYTSPSTGALTQAVTLSGVSSSQPAIAVDSSSVAFGNQVINTGATHTVNVSNTSGGGATSALQFSAITVSGSGFAQASGGTCSTGTALAAGNSCTVNLSFDPTALGAATGSLTLASNDPNHATETITLSGTGIPVPVPQASLSSSTLAFGPQTLGGLYADRSLTLTSSGTSPLVVSAIALSGSGFSLNTAAGSCPASYPFTLAVGGNCTLAVTFTPASAGTSYTQTLSVTSNDAASPALASLTGSGVASAAPALAWSGAASLDFGSVNVGSSSAAQTVSLVNNGPGGVDFSLVNTTGVNAASFAVTGGSCAAGTTLYAGQTCTVALQFTPGAAGAAAAQLQAVGSAGTVNGVAAPAFALGGTGVGSASSTIVLTPTSLSFPATTVGTQSTPQQLTLSANGSSASQVTSINVNGPYVLQSQTCAGAPFTLQPGSSCTVTVSFAPQSAGSAGGAVMLSVNSAATAVQAGLSGSGQAATSVSGGGCSLLDGRGLVDPVLPGLVLLAGTALAWRRRTRQLAARKAKGD